MWARGAPELGVVVYQGGLLQGGDGGVSQGLQGVCGKMVFSWVLMMELVKGP